MEQSKRPYVLLGIMAVMTIIAVVVWQRQAHPPKPPPTEPGFYSGPFRSKADPTRYFTEDGKEAPRPATPPGFAGYNFYRTPAKKARPGVADQAADEGAGAAKPPR